MADFVFWLFGYVRRSPDMSRRRRLALEVVWSVIGIAIVFLVVAVISWDAL